MYQGSVGRGPTSRAASSRYKPPCQLGCAIDARQIAKLCGSGETRAASGAATATTRRSRSRTRADYLIAAVHLQTLHNGAFPDITQDSIMHLFISSASNVTNGHATHRKTHTSGRQNVCDFSKKKNNILSNRSDGMNVVDVDVYTPIERYRDRNVEIYVSSKICDNYVLYNNAVCANENLIMIF